MTPGKGQDEPGGMDVTTDWLAWHREYAEPDSPLSRRRRVVQRYLGASLAALAQADEPIRILSMCAGDGADVLGVLAAPGIARVQALLVELDPDLTERARREVDRLGITGVQVRTADAGCTSNYAELAPAHITLACGVFGNIDEAGVRRTVEALPGLLRPAGRVIWTRAKGADLAADASQRIRQLFAECGFTELDFTVPEDAQFRVGLYRMDREPTGIAELPAQLFRFR